jgi:hypothetical protein
MGSTVREAQRQQRSEIPESGITRCAARRTPQPAASSPGSVFPCLGNCGLCRSSRGPHFFGLVYIGCELPCELGAEGRVSRFFCDLRLAT